MPTAPPAHRARAVEIPVAKPKRLKTSAQGYGWRWQQARLVHLRHEPLCRECAKVNRVEAGTDVDHIVSHRMDMGLFWDRSNWQTLCRSCHSKKTAKENGGWGNPVR